MSDNTNAEQRKQLSKEIIEKQIAESKRYIEQAQKQVALIQTQIQHQIGALGYAEHLLKQFYLPSESGGLVASETENESEKS